MGEVRTLVSRRRCMLWETCFGCFGVGEGRGGPWPQMNSHLGSYGTYELECHLIAYVRYMEKLCAGVLVVRALSG